jgi:UDP-glucose 4-epimerase
VKVMGEYGCKRMVFSSSATVYGDARESPIGEDHALSATSPYGRTKLWVEEMLRDTCAADSEWGVVVLRYFNPVGAHPSGMLGEDPKGVPNNLMPYITKVATGKQPVLKVFGDDYPTKDGTGVRDYLHIMDLSRGHVAALDMLQEGFTGSDVFNLGTGNGISVLEMVEAFREASRHPVPYEIHGRRKGDVAVCFADASKAAARLGWVAKHSLEDMCHDLWRFTQRNPDGYEGGAEPEESAEPAQHGVAQPTVQLKSTKAKAL